MRAADLIVLFRVVVDTDSDSSFFVPVAMWHQSPETSWCWSRVIKALSNGDQHRIVVLVDLGKAGQMSLQTTWRKGLLLYDATGVVAEARYNAQRWVERAARYWLDGTALCRALKDELSLAAIGSTLDPRHHVVWCVRQLQHALLRCFA